MPSGDILLRHSIVLLANERWLHEPDMKVTLACADEWMRTHPAKESRLEEIQAKLESRFVSGNDDRVLLDLDYPRFRDELFD